MGVVDIDRRGERSRLSIMIDLMQADQSTYRRLRVGDWVLIDGTLAPDRRHVIARDIWRDDNRGACMQAP
jgi:hypothetical protein